MNNSFRILDIVNATLNNNSRAVTRAKQAFVEASKADTNCYPTQVALREAGTYSEYHRIIADSVAIAGYTLNITAATIRLGEERAALVQIVNVITHLREAIPDNALAAGTFTDKANAALPQIQDLVNTQIVNGAYLFGGVDSQDKPCGDLLISNLDPDGEVTTNYTSSAPNPIEVQVSALGKVTFGNIHAGMPGIAQAIGAMNRLKAPLPNLVEIDDALNQAIALLGQAIALNGIEQEKLKAATIANDTLSKRNMQTITEVFQRDQPEIAAAVKNAQDILGFSLKLLKLELNTWQKIFDIL
ncbi:hypothetical protein [Candidatus Trichorickettsia mobilis]|uniref:hypothetical protein n=1 Tax=Candidatus Trichorickettsia mobilis TaxID=1346319 RepID=UPI002930BCA5|nr:hypothetical protein [Candidatus Trichorickettsia mobilis]